jgi:hypothetical protein
VWGVVTARTVVEQAISALRSVSAPDDVARDARDVANEIDRAWQRSPFVGGLEGNLVARSELVNTLVGERVLDPFRRALGSAPLRIKHGAVMRYRVLRSDDTADEKIVPAPEPRDGDAQLDQRAAEAREELLVNETALATIERSVPAVIRKRPPPWAVWVWPMRWVLGLVHRASVASWRLTLEMVGEARRRLTGIEQFVTQREEREREAREAYYRELRLLCGGGEAGKDVRLIELTIERGLPDNVELVELMGELRAGAGVDAKLVVERDALYAPTPDGQQVELGPFAETIPALAELLARARALTLARRAVNKLGAARLRIESEINRTEALYRARLQKISKLAMPIDKTEFHTAQLKRVRPMLGASVNAVMEHAAVHMGSELAQLGSGWLTTLANATGNDALKSSIATIEEQWPVAAKRIAEEVRMLVMGGAGGIARDLYVEVVSGLRAHGLPEEHLKTPKRAPEVQPVELLGSLVNPSTFTLGGNWLAGLFRSFDARKTDVVDKVKARIERIREVAAAELLDAEPKLTASVMQSLAAQLDTAIEIQQAWLQQAMADEQAAIAKERDTLAPLIKTRDTVVAVGAQLAQQVANLATEQPAVAAASVAAAS